MRARMLIIISVAATLVGCATATSNGNIQADPKIEANAPTGERSETETQATAEDSGGELQGEPTPCSANLTPFNPEGPFYSPGAPERTSLIEPGMAGTPVLLTGQVMTLNCEPLPGALLDFWQTDVYGEYDNEGFQLRGKLIADENGNYQLETILPGLYPGRPAHIHVKVTPPGQPEHTTQIYFPGARFGDADNFVDSELVATLEESSGGNFIATFNFVMAP